MITFELLAVTPEMAAAMLAKNVGNRKLNDKHIRSFAVDMASGNWRLTHQAIAIGADGNLLDGQHRLHAVVKAQKCVQMFVARYSTSESIMSLPIDLHRKRSVTDILACNPRYVEVLNTLFFISKQRQATSSEIESLTAKTMPHIELLHELSTTRPKVRGSSGVRAAVLFRMLQYPDRAAKYAELYRDFCQLNFDLLNSSLMSFVKYCEHSSTEHLSGQTGRNSLFAKSLYAFDHDEPDRKMIRVSKDLEIKILEDARMTLAELIASA